MRYTWNFDGSDEYLNALNATISGTVSGRFGIQALASEMLMALQEIHDELS